MSKCCCKYAKWFPHNWLCLRGLYFLFLGLFYLAFCYAIYQAVVIFRHPTITGAEMWAMVAYYVFSDLALAVGFLTVAKILKVLRKIKQAVAPCCCSTQEAPAAQEETK